MQTLSVYIYNFIVSLILCEVSLSNFKSAL